MLQHARSGHDLAKKWRQTFCMIYRTCESRSFFQLATLIPSITRKRTQAPSSASKVKTKPDHDKLQLIKARLEPTSPLFYHNSSYLTDRPVAAAAFRVVDDAAVVHAASPICNGSSPAQGTITWTIGLLLYGMQSSKPATVTIAAEALAMLCKKFDADVRLVFMAPGALTALQAALQVESAVPAAARVIQSLVDNTSSPTYHVPGIVDMVKPLVTALVRFDRGPAGVAVLNALSTLARVLAGHVFSQVKETEGALARLVLMMRSPATIYDASWAFLSLVDCHPDKQLVSQAIADTDGAVAALTAALSKHAPAAAVWRRRPAEMLNRMAAASPGLAACVVNAQGQVDALVAKGAALKPADCAVLRQGALKALSGHTNINVAAHVAAALAPSLAAADPEVRNSVRSFLRCMDQLTDGTAVSALRLQAAAVQREVAPLSGRVAQL